MASKALREGSWQLVASCDVQEEFRSPGGQGGSVMPEYDYKCEACGKSFTKTMGMLKHDTAKIKCPECKSAKVRQKITSFGVTTKRK
jgi:putative FmdB family regulatory protein